MQYGPLSEVMTDPRSIALALHLLVMLSMLSPREACAQEPQPSSEPIRLQQFVFAGMREERSRLRAGECSLRGTFELVDPANPINDLSGLFEADAAFDGNQLSFSRTEPGWVIDRDSVRPDPDDPARASASSRRGTVKRFYCRNSEYSAHWQTGEPFTRLVLDDHAEQRASGYFDVRSLGVCLQVEFDRGLPLETILAALEKKPVTEVDRSDSDRWTLIWRSDDGRLESESRLTVDVDRGLTPVQFDQRQRRAGTRSQWHVAQSSITEWEQQEDVWVPVQHRIAMQPSADASSLRKTIQFDIEWTSINEEIPPERWTWESFDLPETVGVIDTRNSKARIIRPHQIPLAQRERLHAKRSAVQEPAGQWTWWLPVLLVVNGIAITVLIVVAVARRRT